MSAISKWLCTAPLYWKKYLPIVVGFALLFSANLANASNSDNHDVIVFIGQSNMAGRTPLQSSDYTALSNADLLDPNGNWAPAQNLQSADQYFTLPNPARYTGPNPGQFLGFNRYSNVAKPDKPQLYDPIFSLVSTMPAGIFRDVATHQLFGLVVNARGNSDVAQWAQNAPAPPLDSGEIWAGTDLFSNTVSRITQATALQGNGVVALVIDLGLTDALENTTTASYIAGLQGIVQSFRAAVGNPGLQVFLAQQPNLTQAVYQARNPNAPQNVINYNAALAQWVASDTTNTIHLVRSANTYPLASTTPDAAHFDHDSMTQMGIRYANAIAQYAYGKILPTASAANFAPAHPTSPIGVDISPGHACASTNSTSTWCSKALYVKTPNWSLSQDILVLPHRGLWGFGNFIGNPENSQPAYQAAASQGYGMTEVDYTPSNTLEPRSTNVAPYFVPLGYMSHDYILYRETTWAREPYGANDQLTYNIFGDSELVPLRDRFGNATSYDFMLESDANPILTGAGLLIVADIKQKPDPNPDNYALNWMAQLSGIMYELKAFGQLSQLVVKTPYTPSYIIANLPSDLQSAFDQVLWMPQVSSTATYSNPSGRPGLGDEAWIRTSSDFINVWQSKWYSIFSFEINYKNPTDDRLQALTLNGINYLNILDYAKQTTNYRGGVFSEEPIAPTGNVNRNGVWNIKDANLDMRGDPLFEAVEQPWGNFIVVTTDRADVWQSVQCQIYGAC